MNILQRKRICYFIYFLSCCTFAYFCWYCQLARPKMMEIEGGKKTSIFCVFVYGYIPRSVFLLILLFQYFSWAKSLFSFQPLYFRFPAAAATVAACSAHSICVRFVCHYSINKSSQTTCVRIGCYCCWRWCCCCCSEKLLCCAAPCRVSLSVCVWK